MTNEMVKGHKLGQMVESMLENGRMGNQMVKEHLPHLTETSM